MSESSSRVNVVFSLGKIDNVECPVRIGGTPIFTEPGNGEFPGAVVHLTEDSQGRPCLVAAVMRGPERIVAYQLPVFEFVHMLSHEFDGQGQTMTCSLGMHDVTICPDLVHG